MEKNQFLVYNDLIDHLYNCTGMEELKKDFMVPVRMLIPYTYCSILLAAEGIDSSSLAQAESLYQPEPVCVPDTFVEAEKRYIQRAAQDPVLWLIHGNESTLICESEILSEKERLEGELHRYCYESYDIYDTMQYSIVAKHHLLGVLSLFRTRIDGCFQSDDMFFLRSIGVHLNKVFPKILAADREQSTTLRTVEDIRQMHGLTVRETQILEKILQFYSNEEIAEECGISSLTVQKHIQNLLRKLGVGSRLELFRQYCI